MFEPDAVTVQAAVGGDLVAFESLVRAYQPHLWRFLRHQLGDAALAEDVTQDTFLRAYQHLSTFRAGAKFSTWLFQIARNAGVDALRARARRERLARQVGPPAPSQDPDAHVELHAALASLAPPLREALLLVEVLGLTYRETAGVLGVAEGTVKSRVFRARAELTDWMAEGLTHELR